jgi:hypothetical protein
MSAQAVVDIISMKQELGFKRDTYISRNGIAKKIKRTTMAASVEDRLAKAKAFVESDISGHKVCTW